MTSSPGVKSQSLPGLVVAAANSGAGKTTVTLALLAALRRRGIRVQPFKVGPDFIDPGRHAQVSGRPSHNLDGWMLPPQENRAIFGRWSRDADLVLVEGVMGLYDGFSGRDESGSTAQMAKLLGLPVLLCVDARSMARSLAALVLGFVRFDPKLAWAGVAANRVGSPRHTEYLAEAMESVPDISFLGGLSRDSDLAIPERHLGLVTAEDHPLNHEAQDRLADWIESGLDLDKLLAGLPRIQRPNLPDDSVVESVVRIGVPRDRAFCFYYEENLRRLAEAGAEVVYFSALEDRSLPPDLDGLYIGGGYPEIHSDVLAENKGLISDLGEFARSGRPVYAECGGLMFLSESLEDLEGRVRPMSGLLPLRVRMLPRLKSLGYREAVFKKDIIIGPAGASARGHEFHYSEITEAGDAMDQVYEVRDRQGRSQAAGYRINNVLASYVHLHFGSRPELAADFVRACRRASQG